MSTFQRPVKVAVSSTLPTDASQSKEMYHAIAPSFALKATVLLLLLGQNTSYTLLRRYSMASLKEKYDPQEVLLMGELFKLIFSVAMTWSDPSPSDAGPGGHLFERLSYLTIHSGKMMALAGIYGTMNVLSFVAIRRIDAAVFTVCAQLKILTTAAFSVLILKRRLTPTKWRALVQLVLGCILVTVPQISHKHTTSEEEEEEEEELPKPPVVIDPESGKTLRRSARSTRCPSHLRNSILEAPGLRLEQAQHLDTFQIDHMNKRKAKKEKNDKDQDDEDERKPRGGYRRELVAGSRQHPGNRPLFPLELQAMFKDERCRNIIEFDPVTSVIRVLDIERFEAEVMPRHFNTYTHKTFQRQMRYYDFICCDDEGRSKRLKKESDSKLCYIHRTIDIKHVDDFSTVTRAKAKPRIRPRKGKRRRLEAELASKHRPSKQQNTSSYDHISSSSQRGVLSTIISQSAVSTGLRDSSHASRRIVSSMLPSSSCAEEDSYSSSSSVSDHADSKAATTNDTTTNADWQDDSAHQLLLQIRNFPRRTEK
mmetsp:Transcript_16917/g.20761  ORF Transcript_16917/g.20761 Transcript_16917/m.20761 type:complete len:538 (-) Transcript_16917:550-2163(-)